MMKYTFQHYIDVSTSATSMQVIEFKAGGSYLMQRIAHLFPAYKYWKMGKVSIKCIPASTLPVDPLGLSYSDTDPQTVDPRDQMNPGLVRITNGEDVFTDVSSLSDQQQEAVYQQMMLDPRWSKFMLQSGFKRTAVPLFWDVAQAHQDAYPGFNVNVPMVQASDGAITTRPAGTFLGTATNQGPLATATGPTDTTAATLQPYSTRFLADSSEQGLFQIGHKKRMGWLPTDALLEYKNSNGTINYIPLVNNMPSVKTITCVLPKAFKTLYYYRIFITETVYLSGVKNFGIDSPNFNNVLGLDQFVTSNGAAARLPGTAGFGQTAFTSRQNIAGQTGLIEQSISFEKLNNGGGE